jgi:16S rRNA (guanine527-N7)-methyltransferase
MSGATFFSRYFPDFTDQQIAQFQELLPLYQHWNSQINVVSRKDIDELMVRHVLHSLAIAKVIQFKPESSILDVGTGGGFPGIPLAIAFPETEFHLIDSIGKKIKVVKEVSNALGLKNVRASQLRAEKENDRYDFVVSRAVTKIKPFWSWVHQNFKSENRHALANGILYLKGGDLREEMSELRKPWKEYLISDFFEDSFFDTKKVVYLSRW